ncbi:MAG TPA: DNA-protecting protein DprA, partial [Luteimonas sp.]|nr:DNA-protecting protein DprA [Luteimonas sp.]
MDPREAIALLRLVATGGATRPRRVLLDTHGTAAAALAAGSRGWRAAGLIEAQCRAMQAPADESLRRTLGW